MGRSLHHTHCPASTLEQHGSFGTTKLLTRRDRKFLSDLPFICMPRDGARASLFRAWPRCTGQPRRQLHTLGCHATLSDQS
jgi:hypothetical protein